METLARVYLYSLSAEQVTGVVALLFLLTCTANPLLATYVYTYSIYLKFSGRNGVSHQTVEI